MQRFDVPGRHQLVVHKGEGHDWRADRRILRAHRFTFRAHRVLPIQAPPAPLRHDALGKVAHLAQPLAGVVAEETHGQRHHHEPQPPHFAPDRRCTLTPVTAASGDGHDLGNSLPSRNQGEDLTTKAVSNPIDRLAGCTTSQLFQHCATVARPVEEIRLKAAKASVAGQPDAPIVEGHCEVTLLCKPAREGLVVTLAATHCRNDQDGGADFAVGLEVAAGESVAVGGGDGENLDRVVCFRHGSIKTYCSKPRRCRASALRRRPPEVK